METWHNNGPGRRGGSLLDLPMRDGNTIAIAALGQGQVLLLDLPMRDGNTNKETTTEFTWEDF